MVVSGPSFRPGPSPAPNAVFRGNSLRHRVFGRSRPSSSIPLAWSAGYVPGSPCLGSSCWDISPDSSDNRSGHSWASGNTHNGGATYVEGCRHKHRLYDVEGMEGRTARHRNLAPAIVTAGNTMPMALTVPGTSTELVDITVGCGFC